MKVPLHKGCTFKMDPKCLHLPEVLMVNGTSIHWSLFPWYFGFLISFNLIVMLWDKHYSRLTDGEMVSKRLRATERWRMEPGSGPRSGWPYLRLVCLSSLPSAFTCCLHPHAFSTASTSTPHFLFFLTVFNRLPKPVIVSHIPSSISQVSKEGTQRASGCDLVPKLLLLNY